MFFSIKDNFVKHTCKRHDPTTLLFQILASGFVLKQN